MGETAEDWETMVLNKRCHDPRTVRDTLELEVRDKTGLVSSPAHIGIEGVMIS